MGRGGRSVFGYSIDSPLLYHTFCPPRGARLYYAVRYADALLNILLLVILLTAFALLLAGIAHAPIGLIAMGIVSKYSKAFTSTGAYCY